MSVSIANPTPIIKEFVVGGSYKYIADVTYVVGDVVVAHVRGLDLSPFGNRIPTWEEYFSSL